MIRRRAALAAASAIPGLARAQAPWPDRPARFINPFTAGSAVDVVTRLIAADMSERLGQQFIVDNRTGASGNIGTEAVARARPDGLTLLVGSPGTMGINPFLFRTLPYDAVRDFAAVSHAVSFPQVMVVNPSGPIGNLADLLAAARARPGALNYASSGNGTTSHLAFELLRAATGIDMVHVPFRGGTPAIQAVMAGEVQVALEGLPSLPGFLSAGQLRPIAVTSPERSPKLPEAPAIAETVLGFDASAWVLYFVPAGTPAPIVERLSAEIRISLNRPGVRDRLLEQGATVVGADPATTETFHRRELEKWRRAVELSGARVD
jgi:tripartite-type tricarboxylate transporter receptor subunit TctC